MLIEGKLGSNEWYCEVGIVSSAEVEQRLKRWVGRFAEDEDTPPIFVQVPNDVAPVSFFADLIWLAPDLPWRDGESIDEIARQVNELRIEAVRIISAIQARICESSFQPVTEGSERE